MHCRFMGPGARINCSVAREREKPRLVFHMKKAFEIYFLEERERIGFSVFCRTSPPLRIEGIDACAGVSSETGERDSRHSYQCHW